MYLLDAPALHAAHPALLPALLRDLQLRGAAWCVVGAASLPAGGLAFRRMALACDPALWHDDLGTLPVAAGGEPPTPLHWITASSASPSGHTSPLAFGESMAVALERLAVVGLPWHAPLPTLDAAALWQEAIALLRPQNLLSTHPDALALPAALRAAFAERQDWQAQAYTQLTMRRTAARSPHPKGLDAAQLRDWWLSLSPDWQCAFNQAVLGRGETVALPDVAQLRELHGATSLEIVGNGILLFGMRQLSFRLTDLSGLMGLRQLRRLNLSGHALTHLRELADFPALEYLNATGNRITTLRGLSGLPHLHTLVLRDNKLRTLAGIQRLRALRHLDVLNNNGLQKIAGVEGLPLLEEIVVPGHKNAVRATLAALPERVRVLHY